MEHLLKAREYKDNTSLLILQGRKLSLKEVNLKTDLAIKW